MEKKQKNPVEYGNKGYQVWMKTDEELNNLFALRAYLKENGIKSKDWLLNSIEATLQSSARANGYDSTEEYVETLLKKHKNSVQLQDEKEEEITRINI